VKKKKKEKASYISLEEKLGIDFSYWKNETFAALQMAV